jgi:hypothetical protein
MENRRDLSISMARANVIVVFASLPVAIAQFVIFVALHGMEKAFPTCSSTLLIVALVLGILVHEFIHGISWVLFGRKPLSSIKFGFQWKTLTPYAHLRESIEISAYRLGTFLPGFVLGILVYVLSLVLGDGNLFLFGLLHTSAAGGDWLVLWLLRHVKGGTLVEDHPTHAGCYVIGEK